MKHVIYLNLESDDVDNGVLLLFSLGPHSSYGQHTTPSR